MSAIDPGQATPPAEAAEQAPPEGQPAETTTAQPEGLDRIYSRMDEMAATQRQMVESMTALMQPEEEEEDESLFYTDEGDLTEEGARAVLADMVRSEIDQAMAPREKARLVGQRDEAFEGLIEQYPELQEQAVSDRVLGAAVRWAQQVNPEIIDRPEFVDVIEAFYKAEKYEALAAQQAAEQPRPVVLESGQGARQQRPNEPDWGDRIVKAAEALRPQI
jgi:hypothetical protein